MITTDKLKPWQLQPANRLYEILQQNISAIDGSDTGTGKTFVAVAIAQAINLPTLAVVPKIAVSGWQRVCEHFNEKLSIVNYEKLRLGHTLYGSWANQVALDAGRPVIFVCECCQRKYSSVEDLSSPCVANAEGIHCVDLRTKRINPGDFRFNAAVKFIIFDECHKCGGLDSLNSELLIAAKRQRIRHLMLSATPAQTILQLKAIGFSLDLHALDMRGLLESKGHVKKVFSGWLASHGAKFDRQFSSWKWWVSAEKQRQTMDTIRQQIFPSRGIRITTDEVPNFPEVDIQAELLNTDYEKEIEELYKEIEGEHELTKILRARQAIELLKVPLFVERARDRMEQGFSVGIFCNFRDSLERISALLHCPFIDGTVTGKKRDEIIAEYQNNDLKCLVLNSEVGSVNIGLQDLDGNFPRFGLVSPPWSATTFKQLVGRFPRDGGKSKSHYRVLFAAGTVEMKMYSALRSKLDNLSALNDGDLQPENLKLKK